MRMQKSPFARIIQKTFVNMLRGQYGRHRHKTAGQSFRQAHEIRTDIGLFAGKQSAGAAKADRDFIGDQMRTVLRANFTCTL